MDAAMRTPKLHRWLDTLTGTLILFLVVWAPWAFGCTIYWATTVLVDGCFALGILLVGKWLVRWRFGYQPDLWVEPTPAGRWVVRGLAGLTVVFLAWSFAGVANASGTVEVTWSGPLFHAFDRTPWTWLPASYDWQDSLTESLRYAAYACAFWATRDWLLAKSRQEKRKPEECPFPPQRLRWLLWTISVSGAALALTGILQRLDGTDKLLWLIVPILNKNNSDQFASYPYRTNAAQYFNLVWPVVLAFWWALHAQSRQRNPRAKFGNEPALALVPAFMLMMAVPIVSTSRGGALMLGFLAVVIIILTALQRQVSRGLRLGLGGVLVTALLVGWILGGEAQRKRFATVFDDKLSGRVEIYKTAGNMVREFGWRGSGAGTFGRLNVLYRDNLEEKWQGYVHDDWLETRITLGTVGLIMAVGLLGLFVASWFTSAGPLPPAVFPLFTAAALAGLLIHAKWDFPFQIQSLRFTFVVICAVLATAPPFAAQRS